MVKKPAGTLPVRKHKFASTPSTGQAITKFFDKKEEQARLQQQLAKSRPAGPPPTFSGHSAVSRAQATHAAPAAATVTSAVPTSVPDGQPAVIHITSAAPSHVQPQQRLHRESDVPTIRLPAALHQSSKHVQQQPVAEIGPVNQVVAVHNALGDVFAANVSAVGVKPPRQKSTTQPSLEFMTMSQDDDDCCIKWQASPQHLNLTMPSQGGLVSKALPNQDVTAMKQRLANAVQRTVVGSAESSIHSQSSEVRDTLLEDLLALPPPQHSRLHKVTSLDRLGTKVLSPTNKSNLGAGSGTPRSAIKTPGTAGRGYSEAPSKRVAFGMEPGSGTPGSMQTGSVFKKKRKLHQVNENFSGTGGKRSGGRKRNSTLIDLLDKVEVMIKSRNVRERLGSDQALQGLPAQPSQDAVLSQQQAATGVLAVEPAGPAEHAPQVSLPKLAGDRVHVHYQVKSVQEVDHEKILHLEGTYKCEQVVVHLRDCWFDTPVEPGHSVNLLAEKVLEDDGVLHAVCNFQAGMVILHPDLLLSGTRVSGSFKCKRQAVLEERFGGSSSDKAVEGTLLHELFQVALTKRITSRARLEDVARAVIAAATDKLLEVGLDEHKAMARLQQAMSSMLSWVQRFLRSQPAQNATVEVGPGEGVGQGKVQPMCVRQVADIEENVWAPKYGLKGMIDASLAVGFQPQGDGPRQSWMQSAGQPQQGPNQEGSVMVPLEFKTGKPHISHRAQVSLYLLLMQERYGQVIESGLLWYLGSLSPQQVRMVPQEIQALIMHRNILAGHMTPGAPLPEVIREPWACDKCFQKAACALSHKACEQGNEESSGLGESYNELTGHMTEASGQFFQHWLRLVELEEAPLTGKRAEIWASSGLVRERTGRCICGLIVDPIAVSPCIDQTAKAVSGQVARHKLLYSFSRASKAPDASQSSFSKDALNEKGFTDGDMVILSIEGEQACVQRPTISSISAEAVTLAVDKPLRGSMLSAEVRWRIDKDEVSSIFTRMRCNLLDLMSPAAENVQQARRLIADLEVPAQPGWADAYPNRAPELPLNIDQQAAVNRVLSTPNYTLILGMPGTGKTSTIAWTLGGERYPDTSVKALRQLSETAQVVACTALGVNHCLLKGRTFDMCIVDEAGQMTLPVALGPILHSKAFTLVGDHYQLPPLVTSRAAEEGGLGISLFKRLCEAHPQMVASLTTQYRMAEDIMLLANTIVYKGQLRCGADHVAEAVLDLPVAPSQVSQPDWLVQVLIPHRRGLFLDTDGMPAPEVRAGDALSNPREAAVLTDIVKALDLGKVPLSDVGVISPYRAQVLLLQRLCKDMAWKDLEVLTVDKCQGRDKDVVLLSLVRSNEEQNAGNLLKDWRRLNVAITRAKKKLILLGSQKTLRTIPHFAQLLDLMTQKQCKLASHGLDAV
ncbi:hypothetical protein WJX79_001622 [Trebouxia sp. C0005]